MQKAHHILGCLKISPRRIYFYSNHPSASEGRINKCDWEYFYRDDKQDMLLEMPEPLERAVETHVLVDASHAAEKMTRMS